MFTVKHRMFIILILLTVMFGVMAGRVAWMQLHAYEAAAVSGKNIAQLSVMQRERGIVLDSGRGDFYDRYGAALTGRNISVLVFFPVSPVTRDSEEGRQQLRRLAQLLHISDFALEQYWKTLKQPEMWSAKETGLPIELTKEMIQSLQQVKLHGIRVLDYHMRYDADIHARQWLGFIAEQPELISQQTALGRNRTHTSISTPIGAQGLEKTFDPFLRGVGPTTITYFMDAAKRPLIGLDTRVTKPANPYYPLQVMTTVDVSIQSALEKYADEIGFNQGAIVVLDVNNSDIVAMVSKPDFNPYQVNPTALSWGNRATKALIPGSIYKIVTTAAALETIPGIQQATFDCHGSYGKYGFSCWKKDGHGLETLEQGFANSCNIVFGTIGEHLPAEVLARYASMLGLSRTVGWQTKSFLDQQNFKQIDGEEAGQVFAASQIDGGNRVQSAVGQRDVRVTPLQAANMVVTLLHDGQVLAPRLVQEIKYANGQLLSQMETHAAPSVYGAIQPATARTILKWMREVVTHGTGTALLKAKWEVAGKSGTAQVQKTGHAANNHWFIGYGPVSAPRYAVAVVAENQPITGANLGTQLFRGVMDILADYSR